MFSRAGGSLPVTPPGVLRRSTRVLAAGLARARNCRKGLAVGHAPKDQSNRRKYMPDYAVWEIHPVMKLDVKSD